MKKTINSSETGAIIQLVRTISLSITRGLKEKIPLLCISSTADTYGWSSSWHFNSTKKVY
ncbi:hypothetical protein [Bacillus solitudinis]|uniref:hypothetical protein n=1 Tax=Bacillus solitudinis TaxID=2014074 RepID=UPI000C248B08|nr:hypothetical protein [Bacillus solitudinis]